MLPAYIFIMKRLLVVLVAFALIGLLCVGCRNKTGGMDLPSVDIKQNATPSPTVINARDFKRAEPTESSEINEESGELTIRAADND